MGNIDIAEISSETIYSIGGDEFEPNDSSPEEIYTAAIEGGHRFVEYANGQYLFATKTDAIYFIRCNWPE